MQRIRSALSVLVLFLSISFLSITLNSCATTQLSSNNICTVTEEICGYAEQICDKNPNAIPSNAFVLVAQNLKVLAGLNENPIFNTTCQVTDKVCNYAGLLCEDFEVLHQIRQARDQLKLINEETPESNYRDAPYVP